MVILFAFVPPPPRLGSAFKAVASQTPRVTLAPDREEERRHYLESIVCVCSNLSRGRWGWYPKH